MDGKKQITQTWSFSFGKNGDHERRVTVEANNFREPMITFSNTSERITSEQMGELAGWLIAITAKIASDEDLFSGCDK